MFYDLRDKLATGRLISGLKNVGSYIPGALAGGAGGVLGGSLGGGLIGSAVGGIRDDITWKEGARRGMEAGALLGGAAGAAVGAPLYRAMKHNPTFYLEQLTTKIVDPSHKVPWFINPSTLNNISTVGGIGTLAATLPFMDEKMAGSYARSPYVDKHAISQGMLFWKGLKRPFSTAVRGRRGKAVQRMLNQPNLVPDEGYQIHDLFGKMNEVSKKLYRVPAFDDAISKRQLNDIINRVHINKLNRVAERLSSNIDKAPSYFGALKQSFQASPAAYRAGMLAVPTAVGAAGLGGIGYAVWPEDTSWYDRLAGYAQVSPYLDKVANRSSIYNRLMQDPDPSFRIVAGMKPGIADPIEHYAQAMQKDPSGREFVDSTTHPSMLHRIVSGGFGALGGGFLGGLAASAIAGRPGFFGPSDTDKNIIAGGLLAGALGGGFLGQKYLSPVLSRSQAANNLEGFADAGINDYLRGMSEKDADYSRLKAIKDRMNSIAYYNKVSGYGQRNPYLDKRSFNWTSPIALTYRNPYP